MSNCLFSVLKKFSKNYFQKIFFWMEKFIFFSKKNFYMIRNLIYLFYCGSAINYYNSFLIFLGFLIEKWRQRKQGSLMYAFKTIIWNFPFVRNLYSFHLVIRGKFNMKPRSRSIQVVKKKLPKSQTYNLSIQYYYTLARHLFGSYGLHFWAYYT
jgi:hypothetical protein